MAEEQVQSESEKKKEDWMNSKWRPMMGWMYMLTCMTDFVIFPILWSLLQAVMKTGAITQWQPLTLQGAGLFHIAMGAVIGISAYGRTQEKLSGANNGGINLPSSGTPAFSAPATNSFSPAPTPASSFGSTPTPSPAPATSFGGGFGGSAPATTTPAVGKFGKVIPQDDQPVL